MSENIMCANGSVVTTAGELAASGVITR